MKRIVLSWLLMMAVGEALAAPAVVRLLQAPAWRERHGERVPLKVGLEFESGDTVSTGPGARALLGLSEGSLVKIGESADVALKDLLPAADEHGVFKGFLDVLKGAFRFTTTLADRQRDLRVQVRSATIGIRGTDVWGKAEDARDFVVLLEGRISIERDGQSYQLDTPLSLFMAPRGEAARPIGPVNNDDLTSWAQETEPQPGAGVVAADGRYHLNLASFTSAAGADHLVSRLAQSGYGASTEAVAVGGRDWWRVVIAGFASRTDAEFVAAALRARFDLSSPWISNAR